MIEKVKNFFLEFNTSEEMNHSAKVLLFMTILSAFLGSGALALIFGFSCIFCKIHSVDLMINGN